MSVRLPFTSPFSRLRAAGPHAGKCPACGREVRRDDHAVRLHGTSFHGACALYRPAGR